MSAEQRLRNLLDAPPDALGRLGSAVFVETPLYRANTAHKPVYINEALFDQLLKPEKPLLWAEKSYLLEQAFSTTVEAENSTGEVIGKAWVDRQADPLGLSLAGNQGSGRAYYTGQYFNIKGERTMLATSTIRRYSDGYLEMERAIWETLIANALQGSLSNGLYEVLAIFDMDAWCDVVWRNHSVRRAKIIRVDRRGELDRVSHVFYKSQPLRQKELVHTAQAFGRLEGEKFMERIVHGTWSPGNISLSGHFIDFDTNAGVKGRAAQYSSTQWHHENYFGYEHKGQELVLKALCNDATINRDGIAFKELKPKLRSAMGKSIACKLVWLMGFSNVESLTQKFSKELLAVGKIFSVLARRGLPTEEALFSKDAQSLAHHLFDFSALLRVLPLLHRTGKWDAEYALTLMCDDMPARFSNPRFENLEEKERNYMQRSVLRHFAKDFIGDMDAYATSLKQAKRFVNKLYSLFRKMLAASNEDMAQIEAYAYVRNEDRFYFFPVFALSYYFAGDALYSSRHHMHQLIATMIASGKRHVSDQLERHHCDIRIFREGYLSRTLDGKGYYRCYLTLFKEKLPRSYLLHPHTITVQLDGKKRRTKSTVTGNQIRFDFPLESMEKLLSLAGRNGVFVTHKITLECAENQYDLQDYIS